MSPQVLPYVLPLLAVVALSVPLVWTAWRRRASPGSIPFALQMLAVAEWSLTYAFELVTPGLPAKVVWAKVEYLGIVALPVTWLAFALEYTWNTRWLTRSRLLALEPAIALLLVLTNDAHGLIWRSVRLELHDGFPIWVPTYGPGFWVHAAYSYLLLLLGSLLLLRGILRSPNRYRGQVAALLLAAVAPWLGNALYLSGFSPLPYLDLTPFSFAVSGAALAWALYRFRLLDLAPVARDRLVKRMGDGLIVLDALDRVVDLNPAAARLLGGPAGSAIGRPADQVLHTAAGPDLLARLPATAEAHAKVALDRGAEQTWLDLRVSPLLDRRDRPTGRLVVLRDITELKQAEAALRAAHAELEVRVETRTAELSRTNRQLQEEVAERRRAEDALRYRAAMENLIASISTNFIGLPLDEIDAAIGRALQAVGEFARVDRSYVFQLSASGTAVDNTHEWAAPGIEPQIQKLLPCVARTSRRRSPSPPTCGRRRWTRGRLAR